MGKDRGNGSNNWRPSREHSIEELPIALGFLIIASGNFEKSIFGASNYGRDNDSIAGMVGAISGAFNGAKEIRKDWMGKINKANRVDLVPIVKDLYDLRLKLHDENISHIQSQKRYFETLKKQIN